LLASFIGGLGGRDIPSEEFFQIATVLCEAAEQGSAPPPRLLYTENELREVRKLQAIASVERRELREKDGE
jgi:pyruvate ferredoxin oxidoreductase alpha subunit